MLGTGPMQILVNNAGIHDDAAFPGMSASQWHRVIDVSVNGFYNVTQPLVLPMIRTRWGRIVNISSVAALTGNRGQVNYAAAKGALNAATKSLSLEVASRGITVNAVAPGIIASGMGGSAFGEAAIANLVPMKRAGTAEEVGGLVAYLASARSRLHHRPDDFDQRRNDLKRAGRTRNSPGAPLRKRPQSIHIIVNDVGMRVLLPAAELRAGA